MSENADELTTTVVTFRFSSGEILTLDEDQIEKIPYLTALVSSAVFFESSRDEDGHYKLNPNIIYAHFSFVLESLSFHSVRQLFTHLPKQNDIIPIIALLDFLGMGPQPDPTLNEVDSAFFSTLVYSPFLAEHLQIVRPSIIQDMAARFAIAMAKEEYDFNKQKVIDQIYWFVMFILSAKNLFGPRLRHHVYKIAEHCFSLFKPSLLKPLKQLILRTEKEGGEPVLTTHDVDILPDDENKCSMEQMLYPSPRYIDLHRWWRFFQRPELEERRNLLLYRTTRDYGWRWFWLTPMMKDLITPSYERVLEIMYERLQSDICQQAIIELRGREKPCKFVQEKINFGFNFYIVRRETLPERIDDLFKSELIQKEICERILEEMRTLTPKLEQRHAQLLKRIQEHTRWLETSHENEFDLYWPILLDTSDFESMQDEALSLELALEKSDKDSTIFKDIYRRVLDSLGEIALQQFNSWENTQHKIDNLYQQSKSTQSSKKSRSDSSKTMRQHHRVSVNQSLPKHRLKYSGR